MGKLIYPIRSTTQTWVVPRLQYVISVLVSQTSFSGETSGAVAKCRLFSQASDLHCNKAKEKEKTKSNYSLLKKIFNGALIPITPASSHLSSLHFFKQNILVKKYC